MSDTARHGKSYASGLADQIRPGALFRKLIQEFAMGGGVHAYLFVGPGGVGKRTLASQCAMAALCERENKPCFQCPPCIRFLDGSHPDVKRITSEKTIGVDAIREAVRLSGEHTYEGGRRAIIIEQAERMTVQAQNSLLKTLEEPPGDTIFILTAEDVSALLPTVVSRCRVIHIPLWAREEMGPALLGYGVAQERIEELYLSSGGSVGQALTQWQDPRYGEIRAKVLQSVFAVEQEKDVFFFSSTMRDEKEQADAYLDTAEILLREVLLYNLGERSKDALKDFPPRWRLAAESAPIASLQRMMDAIFLTRRRRASQVNWQAVLEELLLKITEEVKAWQQ